MDILKLDLKKGKLAQMMDFSSLNPNVTKQDIIEGCKIAKKYNFKGFHVNPIWVPTVAQELEGSGIETGYVVSFPFGTNPTQLKVAEAKHAVGILKGKPWVIDMVTNVGKLRGKEYDYYKRDIAEVTKVAHDAGIECKAILEIAHLTDDEIRAACEIASEAGADWVKTSTGRHGGPTLEQVRLMRQSSPSHVKVKVAGTGSFWTPMVVLGCILAGAERIGTRNAPWIVDELSGIVSNLLDNALYKSDA